jgi:hypothetical protein
MVPWIYIMIHVIAYLQVGQVLIGLTPKEQNHVIYRAKWFNWEDNSFLSMWVNG